MPVIDSPAFPQREVTGCAADWLVMESSAGSIMVGEIDSVSPTFSMFRGGLFWLGGFAIIFLTIVVIVSLSDSANTVISSRTGPGAVRRGSADNEPSMGLTPETAAPPTTGN